MKMPRSHCESDNIQFVQELAEVDGPFEAPINVNFRDLIKIELPSLVWNRGNTSPKKMKITNTGHTVIVSGKWKCERPYLTGGPLSGKYVFSQIHFHWGQDDCKGSEHQICGEGFPLEMHVAHFKTEYLTQENALREKDGMVVVVYLFKLQEEPNQSLKTIINCLSNVKQPSTSQIIDPRPILSLCHPFTDDYFMYWGSVVTSTCAHILLWLISREPFGISREQVKEFRKIMDSSQQPIFRNNKDIQPLHKRNVFHVNASKFLDQPLLPIKKLTGCYCKGNEKGNEANKDNNVINVNMYMNGCHCSGNLQNQEDVEGHLIEYLTKNQCFDSGDRKVMQSTCFANQTFFVHTTHVHSVSILLRRCGSDPLKSNCNLEMLKRMNSEGFGEIRKKTNLKSISQSCCFLPLTEAKKIKNLAQKKKNLKNAKLSHSVKAFSQIMQSLESLKNHTFKKLKEIESINQEIKEMKPLCQDTEEKKWIRKIENVMTGQKQFIIKSSQGCLSEIRKLAKDLNLDKFFDAKTLSDGNRNRKVRISPNKQTNNENLLNHDDIKEQKMLEIVKAPLKCNDLNNVIHFSSEAQNMIESFFEDIKESEDLKESVKKDLSLKKMKSLSGRQGNSNSLVVENKNYITQKMFTLGNLGNRFFTEVTTEECSIDDNQWKVEKQYEEELISTFEISQMKSTSDKQEDVKTFALKEPEVEKNEELGSKFITEVEIPLHRADVGILLSKTSIKNTQTLETLVQKDVFVSNDEKAMSNLENHFGTELSSSDHKFVEKRKSKKVNLKDQSIVECKNLKDLMCERLLNKSFETKVLMSKRSGSDFSTGSTEIQRTIFAKVRQSKKDFWEHKRRKSSGLFKIPSKRFHNRANSKKFEGYYIQKNKFKIKKRKSHKSEKMKRKNLNDLSSTSKDESKHLITKRQRWKPLSKAKFKLEIPKTKDSTSGTSIENILISPDRKRLKLDYKKPREYLSRDSSHSLLNNNIYLMDKKTRTILTNLDKESAETEKTTEQEYSAVKLSVQTLSEGKEKFTPESTVIRSRNISRTTTNKSLRASSVGSKLSHVISEGSTRVSKSDESLKVIKHSKKEISNLAAAKFLPKNKSLSNLINSPENITTHPRILESINVRKRINKESFIPRRKLECPKKVDDRPKTVNLKELSNEVSKEMPKLTVVEKDSKLSKQSITSCLQHNPLQSPSQSEYKVNFMTRNSSQVGNKLLPLKQNQIENEKPIVYQEHPEILHRTDSNKSLKDDEDSLTPNNKDFQISASYSILKKDLICRPHSAESLPSKTKTLKQKGKKRPHCSKKISTHYLRKNSSVSKRPNKAEKQLNVLNLTDEEQLKIISENVMKYLKEKLKENEDKFEEDYLKEDILSVTTDEMIPAMKNDEEKKEKSIQNILSADKNLEKKPVKMPDSVLAVKAKDKKEEKLKPNEVLRKPKVALTEVEVQEVKSVLAPPKRTNNFIKLNKQMAGKYKKISKPSVKKEEIKVKETRKPESRPSTATSKPKVLTPKTKKEETPIVGEHKELISSKLQTPKSPRNSQLSPTKIPQKESQLKTPRTYKKTDSNIPAKELSGTPPPPPPGSAKKSSQLMKSFLPVLTSPKIPRPRKYLNSNNEEIFCPTSPREDQTIKTNSVRLLSMSSDLQCPVSDSKIEMQEETRSDNMFEKELEYFIKLQMCLNSDLTKSLENPLNYEKSNFLHQNCRERSSAADNVSINFTAPNFESFIKRIITMETKDLMTCSSTSSNLTEEVTKHSVRKLEQDSKSIKNFSFKTMRESNNAGVEIWGLGKEKQEESNSDSSYDCKISITLNSSPKDGDDPIQSYDIENCLTENSNSLTFCLEEIGPQSTAIKPLTKTNDIPIEMKEKLLEILEGEINREMALKCGTSLVSQGNSNDWLTNKEEDSLANIQSQSTLSSCDNIEIFSQISSTMRQYLTYMKQLPDTESQE